MTITTSVPDRPATEAQRAYLRDLIQTREIAPDLAPTIARIGAGHRLTLDEASHLISRLKSARSHREVTAQQIADEVQRWRDWMWGADGVDETTVAQRWDSLLARHFHIQREVSGTHFSGHKVRIDRVLWPLKSWSSGSYAPVGFEIKTAAGRRNDASQAADYAVTRWRLDPPSAEHRSSTPADGLLLVGLHRNDREDSRQLAPFGGFAFVIDHVKNGHPRLSLYFNGSHMWIDGHSVNNKWTPIRKVGAR